MGQLLWQLNGGGSDGVRLGLGEGGGGCSHLAGWGGGVGIHSQCASCSRSSRQGEERWWGYSQLSHPLTHPCRSNFLLACPSVHSPPTDPPHASSSARLCRLSRARSAGRAPTYWQALWLPSAPASWMGWRRNPWQGWRPRHGKQPPLHSPPWSGDAVLPGCQGAVGCAKPTLAWQWPMRSRGPPQVEAPEGGRLEGA